MKSISSQCTTCLLDITVMTCGVATEACLAMCLSVSFSCSVVCSADFCRSLLLQIFWPALATPLRTQAKAGLGLDEYLH